MKKLVLIVVVMLFLFSRRAYAASGFVTRSGSKLYLGSQVFKFSGANIHWLGLKDNNGGTYPTHAAIDDVFSDASAMGMNVVRSHSLGISMGCPNCLVPTPTLVNNSCINNWNTAAWETIDYAIKVAKSYNIRLIIPLTDEYAYYHGGIHNFLDCRGISDQNQFYTNTAVIADFKKYISQIINHVNQYTGIANKDELTILAWEEGNELGWSSGWGDAQGPWALDIANYIKSLDQNHLVADGHPSEFKTWLTMEYNSTNNIDMYTAHYPPYSSWINTDDAFIKSINKVYYFGEYTWIDVSAKLDQFIDCGLTTTDIDKLRCFLSKSEDSSRNISGDLFWDFYDNAGNGGDAYTFHWPGDNAYMQTAAQLLVAHITKMKGRSPTGIIDLRQIISTFTAVFDYNLIISKYGR